MSGRVGSITTDIIADGLIFNMDAANRASYIPNATTAFNTIDLSQTGSLINEVNFLQPPISASCWDFDGVDDYVDSNFIIPAISTYTISCWIKNNGVLGSFEGLIGDMNSSGQSKSGRAAIAVWSTGYIYVNMGNGSAYWYDNTSYDLSAYLDNAWHHIALTIDGTALKLYVDGVLKYTYTSTVSAGTIGARPYRIGSSYESTSGVWGGYIANTQIYNRALSSTEVLQNYNALKSRFGL